MAELGRRRAAAVGRAGPAVPHRLRGHAPRAADDARAAPRRRRHARRAPARGAAGGRAARRVRPAVLGRDRRPDRHRRRPRRAGRRAWPSATAPGPASSSTCRRALPAAALRAGRRRSSARCGPARTPPRSPRSGAPGRPPTGSPLALQTGRDRARSGRTEAEVSADIGRRLLAEGHQRVNFAIVAAGAERGQPPPRARRRG